MYETSKSKFRQAIKDAKLTAMTSSDRISESVYSRNGRDIAKAVVSTDTFEVLKYLMRS